MFQLPSYHGNVLSIVTEKNTFLLCELYGHIINGTGSLISIKQILTYKFIAK